MKSIVIGLRTDIRAVATLAMYWQEKTQQPPKHIGTLIRDMLESLANNISAEHTHLRVETIGEAQQILSNMGLAPKSRENQETLMRGLQVENMKFEQSKTIPDQEFIDAFKEAQERLQTKQQGAFDDDETL